MSWTPANSTGTRVAHASRIRVLSEDRESGDPSQSRRKGPGSSPRSVRLFSHRSTPLSPFFSTFGHRFRKDRGDARAHSHKWKWAFFCTVLVQSKSFRCNTSEPPSKCCKQRTCATSKFFTCNIYKNTGVLLLALILNPLRSSLVTRHPLFPGGGHLGVN